MSAAPSRSLVAAYRAFCDDRAERNLLRTLGRHEPLPSGMILVDGQSLVNFASNDYLGLSRHPALIERAKACAEMYGAGSTASRLVCGNLPLHADIERRLAAGKGQDAALVMASGYQANVSVLAALADKNVAQKPVTVLADRLVHHSLVQGAMLSGARLMRFRHNDARHLETLLKAQRDKDSHIIVVTESVFSMDGDRADLATLGELAHAHDALFYVDEAHATGLFGAKGFGLASMRADLLDVAMGTFGKALGSFGAYVACSSGLRDYLVQRCGGLIYSTALPPAVLGAIDAALELLPTLDAERTYVLGEAERVRRVLSAQGWDCGPSTTQIIPVIVGEESAALELAAELRRRGFFIPAIRPPTVPPGTTRLRLSLSAAHRQDDIDRLLAAMGELSTRYNQ